MCAVSLASDAMMATPPRCQFSSAGHLEWGNLVGNSFIIIGFPGPEKLLLQFFTKVRSVVAGILTPSCLEPPRRKQPPEYSAQSLRPHLLSKMKVCVEH